MKTIKGICIKKRNFDKFKKVADLIYFDGPLLSHYVTNKGDNYLFYWIDQDDTNNRWMFIRTDYDNIQKYTNKKQTLRNVLSSPLDDIVYTVDIDEEGNHHNFQAHSIEDLPEDYLPTEDSYYDFEPEDVNKENLSIAEDAFSHSMVSSSTYHRQMQGRYEQSLVLRKKDLGEQLGT